MTTALTDLMSFTDNEGALCSSKCLSRGCILHKASQAPESRIHSPHWNLTASSQPCVLTAAPHEWLPAVHTSRPEMPTPRSRNERTTNKRCRALPGRRGHRMLMQPEERVGPRLPASASAGSQLSARHCGAATDHRALPQTLGGGEGSRARHSEFRSWIAHRWRRLLAPVPGFPLQ